MPLLTLNFLYYRVSIFEYVMLHYLRKLLYKLQSDFRKKLSDVS